MFTSFERSNEILGGLLGEFVELQKLRFRQGVQVGGCFNEATGHKLLDHGGAEVFDIHAGATGEVLEGALLANGVVLTHDAPYGLARVALGLDAECFEVLAEDKGLAVVGAFVEVDAEHLRDDLASLLHEHGVAGADVFTHYFVLVVKCGARDGGAGQLDRLEDGNRRDSTRAADLQADLFEQGLCALGLELVGDRPAGCF